MYMLKPVRTDILTRKMATIARVSCRDSDRCKQPAVVAFLLGAKAGILRITKKEKNGGNGKNENWPDFWANNAICLAKTLS